MHGLEQQNAQECESSCDTSTEVGLTFDAQKVVCRESCNRMGELTALNPGNTSFGRLLESLITFRSIIVLINLPLEIFVS